MAARQLAHGGLGTMSQPGAKRRRLSLEPIASSSAGAMSAGMSVSRCCPGRARALTHSPPGFRGRSR